MYAFRPFIVILALLTAACGNRQPSVADIREQFALDELPGLIELKAFELDARRNIGNDESPIWLARYTAEVAVREDTFEIDTVEGETRLLKPVRKTGESFRLYGTVQSDPSGDGWRHRFQRDGSSNPVLGRPRGDYGPDALVADTPEAQALLADIERQRDQERIAAETARAAEAAERQRTEEAEAAKRQRIEEAVARHNAGFAPNTVRSIFTRAGDTLNVLVTAKRESSTRHGEVYGTGRYGYESDFPRSVVHAGLLRPGETGIVEITHFYEKGLFQGSPRNGVDSLDTDRWNTYSMRLLERIDWANPGDH